MPRKVFTAGEILTAANLNDVSDATVMVFDDATARTTAIPTPVEGMVTYLEDVGGAQGLEVFDGAVFTPVAIVPEPAGLVAVKSAIRDTTEVFSSVAEGANVAVTGLSITHEVADPDNRLIISAFFGAAASSNGRGAVGLAVHDGTGLINVGPADSRISVTAGGFISPSVANLITTMPSVTFVHTPGAGSKTYTVRAIAIQAGDIFINRTQLDSTGDRPRAVSSLMIQEVAV